MQNKLLIILFMILSLSGWGEDNNHAKTVVYLIPGQGADCRLFKNLKIDSSFETQYIHYFTPHENWDMKSFARALSCQIDTTRNFILLGVSLGGMLATEMAYFLNPEKVIIVSSAKNRKEFPLRYRMQKRVHVYEWFPGEIVKAGALIMQPLIEPDRNKDKDVFVSMLKDKDPDFLERTVKMILEWDRTKNTKSVVHIHGNNDHTIPVKNVDYDYMIEGGSHMMILTKGDELSNLINDILLNKK